MRDLIGACQGRCRFGLGPSSSQALSRKKTESRGREMEKNSPGASGGRLPLFWGLVFWLVGGVEDSGPYTFEAKTGYNLFQNVNQRDQMEHLSIPLRDFCLFFKRWTENAFWVIFKYIPPDIRLFQKGFMVTIDPPHHLILLELKLSPTETLQKGLTTVTFHWKRMSFFRGEGQVLAEWR